MSQDKTDLPEGIALPGHDQRGRLCQGPLSLAPRPVVRPLLGRRSGAAATAVPAAAPAVAPPAIAASVRLGLARPLIGSEVAPAQAAVRSSRSTFDLMRLCEGSVCCCLCNVL